MKRCENPECSESQGESSFRDEIEICPRCGSRLQDGPRESPTEQTAGEDEELVAVAHMPNSGAAQMAHAILAANGIRCVINSPHSQFGTSLEVTLLVPRADAERAVTILEQPPQGEYQFPADIAPDEEEEREAVEVETEARRKRIGRASRWVLYLALLLAVGGTMAGFLQWLLYDQATAALSRFSPGAEVPLDQVAALAQEGKLVLFEEGPYTAAELREWSRLTVVLQFGYYYILAVIFFFLYLWARRSPFPALITALSVFLVLEVLKLVLNPSSFASGLLWRALFVVALLVGIQQAIVERGYRERLAEKAAAGADG